jgi:SAM-dependent methyltransferase
MNNNATNAKFDQDVMTSPEYALHGKQIGWANEANRVDDHKAALLLEYATGERILDVGCATGTYTQLAARLGSSVGVDANSYLLDAARASLPHLPFVQGSILQLPFANKSFDTTVAFDILEHVPEKQAFEELIRVTKKRLIVCVPHTTPKELSDLFLLFGHHADTTHLRTHDKQSMRKVLADRKLTPVFLQPSHPLSTDALFLNILDGSTKLKKILRKICFALAQPKQFYSNLIVVADIPTP